MPVILLAAAALLCLATSVALWRRRDAGLPWALAWGMLFVAVLVLPGLARGGVRLPGATTLETVHVSTLLGGISLVLLAVQAVVVWQRSQRRQRSLQRWNDRAAALLGQSPICVAWVDAADRIAYANGAFARLFSRSTEQCVGSAAAELLSDATVRDARERGRRGEAMWSTELALSEGAEPLPVEITAVADPETDGQGAGVGLLVRDLSEQRRGEVEVQRRYRLKDLLASTSTELLGATGKELDRTIERVLARIGRYAAADRVSVRVFDAQDPELIQRSHLWAARPDEKDRSPEHLSVGDVPSIVRRLRAGRTVRIEDARNAGSLSPDERELLAQLGVGAAAILPLAVRGEIFGAVLVVYEQDGLPLSREETDGLRLAADAIGGALSRQRAAQALQEQQEMLRQAQKMEAVGQLAGGVAHDFNNLLTVIAGYAEALRTSDRLGSEERMQVEQIARAGERAARLTSRLLAFGRRQRRDPQPLNLSERVASLESMLRRVVGEGFELVLELAPGMPPVFADPGQLEHVVLNLVLNARDAVGAHGRVVVRTRQQTLGGRQVACLEVEDDGCGIAREHRERIFEPFFTTKPTGHGTGLGLAMVHGIVHQNGGTIEVESEVGVGTIFRVFLPMVEGAVAQPVTPLPAARQAGGVAGRVLLVEDEQAVRDLAVFALRAAGFSVVAAADGEEGLRLAREDTSGFDAIVADVVMPKRSGPEMVAQLPARYQDVPILYMSGYHPLGGGERLAALSPKGPARFFEKPFTPQQLVEQVSALLEGEAASR